jgi:hypothetical protein
VYISKRSYNLEWREYILVSLPFKRDANFNMIKNTVGSKISTSQHQNSEIDNISTYEATAYSDWKHNARDGV